MTGLDRRRAGDAEGRMVIGDEGGKVVSKRQISSERGVGRCLQTRPPSDTTARWYSNDMLDVPTQSDAKI